MSFFKLLTYDLKPSSFHKDDFHLGINCLHNHWDFYMNFYDNLDTYWYYQNYKYIAHLNIPTDAKVFDNSRSNKVDIKNIQLIDDFCIDLLNGKHTHLKGDRINFIKINSSSKFVKLLEPIKDKYPQLYDYSFDKFLKNLTESEIIELKDFFLNSENINNKDYFTWYFILYVNNHFNREIFIKLVEKYSNNKNIFYRAWCSNLNCIRDFNDKDIINLMLPYDFLDVESLWKINNKVVLRKRLLKRFIDNANNNWIYCCTNWNVYGNTVIVKKIMSLIDKDNYDDLILAVFKFVLSFGKKNTVNIAQVRNILKRKTMFDKTKILEIIEKLRYCSELKPEITKIMFLKD